MKKVAPRRKPISDGMGTGKPSGAYRQQKAATKRKKQVMSEIRKTRGR